MAATDITQITPAGSRLRLGVAEIWRARELLYFLTLRDIKIRYKQTAIGIAWAVLQPVLTTLIFTAIFSGWARFDTNDIAYPLFAMTGLTLWLFVQNAVSMASNSFVNNTNLVTKVYFPRLIVPLAATFAALFDLVLSIVVLAALMAYYKAMPGVALLAVPAFLALAVILAAAVGTLLSALNVRFRDVKFAVPFFLQVWMIASPVFYPASMIPENGVSFCDQSDDRHPRRLSLGRFRQGVRLATDRRFRRFAFGDRGGFADRFQVDGGRFRRRYLNDRSSRINEDLSTRRRRQPIASRCPDGRFSACEGQTRDGHRAR
ncbi:MAG: polysaccharide/polyol phosphate ABC transporter permease [Acidobacteria bacterium OLB17]|nr:MAG: polysaccharide/polyol phosphate ABC transporter permease [Acidobacteria bacterium OLB17]